MGCSKNLLHDLSPALQKDQVTWMTIAFIGHYSLIHMAEVLNRFYLALSVNSEVII